MGSGKMCLGKLLFFVVLVAEGFNLGRDRLGGEMGVAVWQRRYIGII
jgi:hypothetical protein